MQENQPFKERYTIQDLENLSGIQAHTLRIWEKRYDLLHPVRAGNNVRFYCHEELIKLLNIAALYHHNYKISKIAALSQTELMSAVRKEMLSDVSGDYASHSIKLALLNFDQALFDQTTQQLLSLMSFRDCFRTVFLPLLHEIGLLWQTGSITIAHEHFLSNILRQKILYQIEMLNSSQVRADAKVYVLFLPMNEVHEMALLYSHYELLLHGQRSIYLGQSFPAEELADLQTAFPAIIFLTFFTIHPQEEKIKKYLEDISTNLLRKGKDIIWVSGRKIQDPKRREKFNGVRYILSSEEFLMAI